MSVIRNCVNKSYIDLSHNIQTLSVLPSSLSSPFYPSSDIKVCFGHGGSFFLSIFPIFLGFGFWVCLRFVFGPNVDDVVHVDLVIILKGLTLQQNLFSMGIKTPNTRIKVGGFLYFYRSGVVVVNYPTR